MEEEVTPGLYRHYAGGLYRVLGLVTHHDTRKPMVHYVSLATGEPTVRPLHGHESDPDGWLTPVAKHTATPSGRSTETTVQRFKKLDAHEALVLGEERRLQDKVRE